jgi:6-pyruvoyltetrahydropterin/6-carboxytetrahydropterin synthase
MLAKHPGLCRYPHGHTRTVEVVLSSESLDRFDMVCDFKVLKLVLRDELARLDHAMAMNSADPMLGQMGPMRERVVVFENTDPTTEVMAKHLFDLVRQELAAGKTYTDERGIAYRFPPGLKLERVRVSETSSTWAEYGE